MGNPDAAIVYFGHNPLVASQFGVRVICEPNALADSKERNFAVSRHRSKRIHKKLVKRFGGEFRKEPAIYKLADGTIICHPVMYEKIKRIVPPC